MGTTASGRSQAADDLARDAFALAIPSAFSIEEVTGRRRRVVLTGRCLPFRPVQTGVEQRTKVQYYPGATEATAQVFGPMHGGMTVRGSFSTRYMDEDHFVLHEGEAFEVVRTAEAAREILHDVCRAGQEVRVCWGAPGPGTEWRGLVTAARFREDRPQDIGWELSFQWTADPRPRERPKVSSPPPGPKALLDRVSDLWDRANDCLPGAEGTYRQYVADLTDRIGAAKGRIEDLSGRVSDLIALPQDALKSMVIVARNVREALAEVKPVATATQDWLDDVGVNLPFAAWVATADSALDDAATQIELASRALELDRAAQAVHSAARRLEATAGALVQRTTRDVYLVRQGDTLRHVATKYYGNPGHWQVIADANDLATDVLSVGQSLVIPELK